MKNALTVDLEDWYHGMITVDRRTWSRCTPMLPSLLERILQILREAGVSATFFVLGDVAERYPDLVERIHDEGHEVASHGYLHQNLLDMSPVEFEQDLVRSIYAIEKTVHAKVKGFRAPYFSITRETGWAIRILERHGIRYDSSIFPVRPPILGSPKMWVYGVPNAPRRPYTPSKLDVAKEDPDGILIEFPPSTYRVFGVNVPIAGGFYLRVLPYQILRAGIIKVNKEGIPGMLYLHPYEICASKPRIAMPARQAFVHYYNLKGAEAKLRRLLRDFRLASAREVLEVG